MKVSCPLLLPDGSRIVFPMPLGKNRGLLPVQRRYDLEEGLGTGRLNGRRTSEESAGVRLDWEIPPGDITICKDAYGRDIKLGHGGFGSVSLHAKTYLLRNAVHMSCLTNGRGFRLGDRRWPTLGS